MGSIKVNSLPLKEVISDIAGSFNTDYSHHCDEYTVALPSWIGEGNIKGINFDSGLGIIQYDCTFHEDMEIQFVVNEIHPLKFLYCIEGVLIHKFGNGGQIHTIEQFEKAIVSSEQRNGHVLCFSKGVHVIVNSLEIARERFVKKIACELKTMDKELQELFNDVHAEKEFYHDGFYSLDLADSFMEIQTFEESDFLKKLFMEGKAYQWITKQIIEYQDDLKDVDHRRILRKTEIKLLEEAANILRNEISKPNTVEVLCKRVGMNPNKLQNGFQHLYGVTINQYMHNLRLELAKEMLLDSDYSMAQIVEKLGLSSASYFSKIFKQKYNITPSAFRNQYINALKKQMKKK